MPEVVKALRKDSMAIHDFLLDAWKEAGASSWGWTGATEKNVQELASIDNLLMLLTRKDTELFLAREDDSVRGFAAIRKIDQYTLELAGIILQESYTGKGLGTALLRSVVESASSQGYVNIIVKTETFNERAIGFYESSGFKKVGLLKEEVDGKSIDVILLKRDLLGPK